MARSSYFVLHWDWESQITTVSTVSLTGKTSSGNILELHLQEADGDPVKVAAHSLLFYLPPTDFMVSLSFHTFIYLLARACPSHSRRSLEVLYRPDSIVSEEQLIHTSSSPIWMPPVSLPTPHQRPAILWLYWTLIDQSKHNLRKQLLFWQLLVFERKFWMPRKAFQQNAYRRGRGRGRNPKGWWNSDSLISMCLYLAVILCATT